MGDWTPEPWEVSTGGGCYAIEASGSRSHKLARTIPAGHSTKMDYANAARIVACVNALSGLNPEAVPRLVEAAEGLLRAIDLDAVSLEVVLAKREVIAALAQVKETP